MHLGNLSKLTLSRPRLLQEKTDVKICDSALRSHTQRKATFLLPLQLRTFNLLSGLLCLLHKSHTSRLKFRLGLTHFRCFVLLFPGARLGKRLTTCAFNQAYAAPLTWPRLPCSSLCPRVPGSVPGTAGQSTGTKRLLYIWRLLSVTGTARRPRGRRVSRAAVANLGSGRPQFRPSSPSPAALALVTRPSPSQARSPGHRRGDPRAPDTAVASRSENNGRDGSKRSPTSAPLSPPSVGSRKSRSRRWARAPPQPESWLHFGAGTTHSDGGGGGAGVSTEALVGSRVLSLGDPDAHQVCPFVQHRTWANL